MEVRRKQSNHSYAVAKASEAASCKINVTYAQRKYEGK
jgi:hypothetical protein